MRELRHHDLVKWLREDNEHALDELFLFADNVRLENVGNEVHLRGLIEISSHCRRNCGYCGLRAARNAPRYRMSNIEVLECARTAAKLGFGTVVLQSGEDPGLSANFVAEIIRQIKRETPLAVTLSLGERTDEELSLWRDAGADRYLLRFETSDRELYQRIHPEHAASRNRLDMLCTLKALGYEAGSGVMVGIPGQTYHTLARDIELFRGLDLDMIGVGPFIPHPETPLGTHDVSDADLDQVPATEIMVLKTVALTRLVCPQANIPSTTALATINRKNGRERGLQSGANVVMPNLTPAPYRQMYEIYPDKACADDEPGHCAQCLRQRIYAIGRTVGTGFGGRTKFPPRSVAARV